jgi:hypothetical protein
MRLIKVMMLRLIKVMMLNNEKYYLLLGGTVLFKAFLIVDRGRI